MQRKHTFYPILLSAALLMAACGADAPVADKPLAEQPAGAVPASFNNLYSGVFKGDTLVLKVDVVNKTISGSYFIKGKEEAVTLSGTLLQDDSAEVYDFLAGGEKGGVFKGLFKGVDVFTGTWSPLPSGAAVPFTFTKTTFEFNAAKYAVDDILAYTLKTNKANKAARCKTIIQYPQFANTDNKPAIDKINAAIKRYFEQSINDCDGLERDEFSADLPDFENHAIGEVVYNTKGLIGISMGWYSYTGGAHPNHGTNTYYFEVATGRELKLIDMVQGANLSKLSALALTQFKKDTKVKKAVDGGLYGESIKLKGSESFYLNDSTLTLVFSPYEIAPYAVGDIEITLGFSKIKPLLLERSAFGKAVK